MGSSIIKLFFAAIAICIAVFAYLKWQQKPSPWRDAKSAVAEASRLLAAGDSPALIRNSVPPGDLEEIMRGSFEDFVDAFEKKKSKRLEQVLQAAGDVEPAFSDDGNTATFHLQHEVSGKNAIALTKIDGRWYIGVQPSISKPSRGGLAPEFVVETTDGQTIRSDALRGNIVVLHFWATWCGPCIRQMPHHIESLSQYDKHDVKTIFVCMNGNDDGVAQTLDEYKIPFQKVLGPDGWSAYGANQLPMDVVIDHRGIIASNSIEDIPRLLADAELK